MLFPCQLTTLLPVSRAGPPPKGTPARLSLALYQSLQEWLGLSPYLHHDAGSCELDLLYQNVTFPAVECAERFGPLLAALHPAWPVQLYGVADSDELVCLTLSHRKENAVLLTEQNTSGVAMERLRDLCLHLCLPDPDTADCMAAVLEAAGRQLPCAALDWVWADIIRGQELGEVEPVNTFCYVFLEGSATPEDKLSCLSFSQKRELWRLFLQDGGRPLEFEWLSDLLRRGEQPSEWLEWSLSLHLTLQTLGYELQRGERHFELLSPDGGRVYYGVDHPQAAERILMKILFPLNL